MYNTVTGESIYIVIESNKIELNKCNQNCMFVGCRPSGFRPGTVKKQKEIWANYWQRKEYSIREESLCTPGSTIGSKQKCWKTNLVSSDTKWKRERICDCVYIVVTLQWWKWWWPCHCPLRRRLFSTRRFKASR